jgi:hypothetical protein
MGIEHFHNRHRDEPVAILANGPSLADHPLRRIACVTIGINQSRRLHDSTYHVALDLDHYVKPGTARMPDGSWRPQDTNYLRPIADRLFSAGVKPYGVLMHSLNPDPPRQLDWSWDLRRGVYSHASTTYVALQLAMWMGFKRIYLLGVDLVTRVTQDAQGRGRIEHGHFYEGHPMADGMEARQREVFGFAAGVLRIMDVQVWTVNTYARLGAFPKLAGLPADVMKP